MRKLILFIAVLFLVACSPQDPVEETKNQKYEDTTLAEMLNNYDYADGTTRWYKDDTNVMAETKISVSEDLEMNQKMVFDNEDGDLNEIIWERKGNTDILKSRVEHEEILGLIYNQKPVLESDLETLHESARELFGNKAKELYDNFKDEVIDELF